MKKLLCKWFGHNWYVSKWGGTLTIPFGDEYKCSRCNETKDMRF